MKTVPLNCNHCGAPLSVPETARFVTCAHCHTQLAIHHEGAAFFTEVLGEIAARTANIEEHLADLQMEKDLERVDAAWEEEQKEILVGGDKGLPDRGMVWACSFLFMIIGMILVHRMSGGRHGISLWFLLIPLVAPWFIGWIVTMQIDRYEESEGFYRRIRQAIVNRRARTSRSLQGTRRQ